MIPFLDDIEMCLEVLHKGGTILYPTDTVWGIGCDATNPAAVAKIYQLKKRAEEKSMIVLLAAEKDINAYVTQPDFAVFDYLKTVVKPTTIIYDGATKLAENAINKDGTIAIRITSDLFCKHLLKRFKKPIISSSANLAGHASPGIFSNIEEAIKNGVDYIVKHRQSDINKAAPSAIIKWNKNGTTTIIRS